MNTSNYFQRQERSEFNEFEQQCIKIMAEIAKAISQQTGNNFVLKGGTALLLAYDLPQFSTDLDFDGKNPSIDLTNIIKESARNAGLTITELNVNKDTRVTKRYMLHYEGEENLPLKIEVSLRNSAQFDEKDVRIVNGIRVYSIEKLAQLKTEAFIHRIKARDTYVCCISAR